MPITPEILRNLIADELQQVRDIRVQDHVMGLLVEPTVVFRKWDYGSPGQEFPCWTVLRHEPSGTGIAYSEFGFGPRCPWGLVSLGGTDTMSMGMDSGWFTKFMDSYFDSFAATDLDIWHIMRRDSDGHRHSMSGEMSWTEAWDRIMELRAANRDIIYDCHHLIAYDRDRPR